MPPRIAGGSAAPAEAEVEKPREPKTSVFAKTPAPHRITGAPLALMVIGIFIMLVASLWNLVVWWKAGVLWFLGGVLIPLVGIIFLFVHWERGRAPFLVFLAGVVVAVGRLVGRVPPRLRLLLRRRHQHPRHRRRVGGVTSCTGSGAGAHA